LKFLNIQNWQKFRFSKFKKLPMFQNLKTPTIIKLPKFFEISKSKIQHFTIPILGIPRYKIKILTFIIAQTFLPETKQT
jgi:hypothetical protein